MRIALLALCCAGCLTTPPAAPQDGPSFDASPIDAGACDREPAPGECNPVGDFTAQAFPGRPFALRSAQVADLNGDGDADLILASNAADNEGIFVLLGPVDVAAPQFHAFLDTDLAVGGIAVRNVSGPSACPELTVAGRTAEPAGVLQIWSYSGAGGVLYDPVPLTRSLDFAPEVVDDIGGGQIPVLVTWARLRAGGDDLLLADRRKMRVLRLGGDLAGLDRAALEVVLHEAGTTLTSWDSLNGLFATPVGDCSLDRVLATEGAHAHVLEGSGTLGGGEPITTVLALGAARADLDGAPPDDVIFGSGEPFGAHLLVDSGTLVGDTVGGDTNYSPYGDSNKLDGFAVGQLGGGAAPEWVAIDSPDGTATGMPRAILIDGLAVTGDPDRVLEGGSPRTFNFTGGFIPRAVVIADLSATITGNQVWVVAGDGVLRCLVRNGNGGLDVCP